MGSSDVKSERTKQASGKSEQIKSKLNSAFMFQQWRHDDYAEWRERVGSSRRPVLSLVLFIQRDDIDSATGKKTWADLSNTFGQIENSKNLSADLAEGFASLANYQFRLRLSHAKNCGVK